MNDMEIKQGDKVRVSSRVPRIYERFGSMTAPHYECKVVEIDDGMALLDSIPVKYVFLFPLKYLVKVDAEAKEPKFKVGDKVVLRRFNGAFVKAGSIGEVWGINPVLKHCYDVAFDGGGLTLEEKYLEPYIEPKEQTESEKTFDNQIRDVLNGVEHKDYGHPIQAVMANLDRVLHGCDSFVSIKETLRKAYTDTFDWDAYTANLAKEIAVKVANKYSDPTEAAEYAVRVAKAVVEGLKRK